MQALVAGVLHNSSLYQTAWGHGYWACVGAGFNKRGRILDTHPIR